MRRLMLFVVIVATTGACSDSDKPGTEAPAPLPRVVTLLDDAVIEAGRWTAVDCVLVDQEGLPLAETTLTTTFAVTAGAVADVPGSKVGSEGVGEYEVTCATVEEPDIATSPATLTVTHAAPATVTLVVEPDKAAYVVGDTVTFSWTVVDAYQNPIEGLAGAVSGPEIGVEPAGDVAYRFTEEGLYTFDLRLAKPYDSLTDQRVLACDGTGPGIDIKSPLRGETLEGDSATVIDVIGTAVDPVGGVVTLLVDGEEVTPDADGSFAATVFPAWGINFIVVEASELGSAQGMDACEHKFPPVSTSEHEC